MSPALRPAASRCGRLSLAEECADGAGRDDGVRRGERDPGDALGLPGDRRDEPDQRAAPVEHRSAAGARLNRCDDDRARLVAGERSRGHGEALTGETEHDIIRRRRAEARRFAPGGEISCDDRQVRRRLRPLEPDRFAVDRGVRAVVRPERGQRLAGRENKRGCGRRGTGPGRSRARSGRDAGDRRLGGLGKRFERIGDRERDAVELRGLRSGIGEGEAADGRVRGRVLFEPGIEVRRAVLSGDDEENLGLDRLVSDFSAGRRGGQAGVETAQVPVRAR